MRRLSARLHGEDGSMVVIVGVLFLSLVTVTAMTIDGGIVHNEREDLQNGADAAALAVAYSCARGSCDTTLAAQYVPANASAGGTSTVESVDVDTVSQVVTVVARTADTPLAVGPLNGTTTALVRARGRAKWGVISSGATAPFVISDCDVDRGLSTQGGVLYDTAPAGLGTIISFHNSTGVKLPKVDLPPECDTGPSGADLPGGFGKIDVDAACKVTTTTDPAGDVWASVDTGAALHDCLNLGPMAIPVFGSFTGSGTTAEYRITGYVGFHVTGWSFPGNATTPEPGCKESLADELGLELKDITGQAFCVSGWFVKYTVPDGPLCTDPAACPFGVTSARITY